MVPHLAARLWRWKLRVCCDQCLLLRHLGALPFRLQHVLVPCADVPARPGVDCHAPCPLTPSLTVCINKLFASFRRALICSAEQGTRIRWVRPIQRVRAPASCEESTIHDWWVSTLESRHVTARGACAFTRSLTRTHHFEMHRSVQL